MAKALIVTSLTFAALLLCGGQSVAQTTPEAFDQLKKLEGEWTGTLRLTPGEHLERLGLSAEQSLTLNYSVRSGGTSLLEESSADGIEMVTVYNAQGNSLLSTHYCVLANRPVGTLDASVNGVLSFTTDADRSGLEKGRDEYVSSWRINLEPGNPNQFTYAYTVTKPDGSQWSARSVVSRAN